MRIKNFIYYFLLLLSVSTLVSCSDDDDEEPTPEPTKTELLVDSQWKGDRVFINKINLKDFPGVGSNAQTFESLRLNFQEDKTFIATFNYDGQERNLEGTWEFNADQTKLTMGAFGEVDVDRLTADNFDVSTTINTNNAAAIAGVFGVDASVILAYLRAGALDTEMRFVKAN
ncbi:hypothetical protein [Pontibacter rugosus]|uniref:Uncharacterized protein n=1 Tax=Pontibacter rugosus TaxID=1745966 RepID=A0ABW3STJ8_9BACT